MQSDFVAKSDRSSDLLAISPIYFSKSGYLYLRFNFQNTTRRSIMKKLARLLTVVVIGTFVFATANLYAETVQNNESDTISQLASEFAFTGEVANHDPFKPVIVKKVIDLIKIDRSTKIEPPPVEQKKEVIPPLKLKVTGICGNDGLRQAIIQFENDEYIVENGQVIDGKFKVVDVNSDKLVVYSIRESRRATFQLEANN